MLVQDDICYSTYNLCSFTIFINILKYFNVTFLHLFTTPLNFANNVNGLGVGCLFGKNWGFAVLPRKTSIESIERFTTNIIIEDVFFAHFCFEQTFLINTPLF